MATLRELELKGIGQNRASAGAWSAKNWAYDANMLGFTSARGFVSFFNGTGAEIGYPANDVSSIFWYRRGSIDYLLVEVQDGTTRKIVTYTNSAGTLTEHIIIDLSAHPENQVSYAGTQYIPFGNFLAIFPEYGQPQKFYGNRTEPFGFLAAPTPPRIWNPPSMAFVGDPSQPVGTLSPDSMLYASNKYGTYFAKGEGCMWFEDTNIIGFGLGDSTKPTTERLNSYAYKISFVSDTGSESPLSEKTATVSWIGGYEEHQHALTYRYGIMLDEVPVGQEGTIKRNLYRTQNMEDGITGKGEVYYLIDSIDNNFDTLYTDIQPDSAASVLAPSVTDSMVMPHGIKLATGYKNRIVIASSDDHPSRVWWSAANAPEQFPATNYFDFGNTSGGEITGLYAHKELVLIFREDSIDALTPTGELTQPFTVTPVVQGIGTKASNTIQAVPNLGVIFLASSGFYVITGNFSGGSQVAVQKLSLGLGHEFGTINQNALSKACATYNRWDNEYWCQVPAYGNTYNSLGFVYHADANAWTTRTNVPAACFTQSPQHHTIFGSNAAQAGLHNNNRGVHAWCAVRQHGTMVVGQSTVAKPSPDSTWRSHWLDFGDAGQQKVVRTVELLIIATGEGTMELESRVDYREDTTRSTNSATVTEPFSGSHTRYYGSEPMEQQDSDSYAKYDQVVPTASTGAAITARMSPARTAVIRFDVNANACRQYSFEITTSKNATVLGFTIHYEAKGERKAYTQNFNKSMY